MFQHSPESQHIVWEEAFSTESVRADMKLGPVEMIILYLHILVVVVSGEVVTLMSKQKVYWLQGVYSDYKDTCITPS